MQQQYSTKLFRVHRYLNVTKCIILIHSYRFLVKNRLETLSFAVIFFDRRAPNSAHNIYAFHMNLVLIGAIYRQYIN